jgi:tryptophan 2,3-dioxygenase
MSCPYSPGDQRLAVIEPTDDQDHTGYSTYACMDALLSLQHPLTDAPIEPGFIILSQVKELLFKLLHTEFGTVRDYLAADRVDDVLWTLRRAGRVQQVLLSCWDALAALSPDEFVALREILGTASGFQSASYRQLEFVLGNKDEELVTPHRGTPRHAEVLAELRRPSLYDEAIRHLARRGLDIPAELLDRDFAQPYQPNEAVAAAWREVYAQPGRHHELFLLAEALTDTAYLFGRWRYTHLLTVQRLLGDKPGTGGTDGSSWLRTIADHRFFPDLWSARSTL